MLYVAFPSIYWLDSLTNQAKGGFTNYSYYIGGSIFCVVNAILGERVFTENEALF